ncbi:hypothetical protein [Clostridium polynesiense]|uniref:hypothetical protein n=1 Tax=Clostridium polynesiense TaxID=1325933 RepID=UPI00058F72C2|nr:hypothetical protein [Clostridium polynesiense]
MSFRGVATSLFVGFTLAFITLYDIRFAFMLLAAFYLVKAFIQVKGKDKFDSFQKITNIDRYNEYIKKDAVFKKFIKSDPIADIIMAGLFIYMSFREYNFFNNVKYALIMFSIIMINYFADLYALKKSSTWLDYKKKNMLLIMGIMVIILFFAV